eukprot:768790-Hanusia_phi.AAC.14
MQPSQQARYVVRYESQLSDQQQCTWGGGEEHNLRSGAHKLHPELFYSTTKRKKQRGGKKFTSESMLILKKGSMSIFTKSIPRCSPPAGVSLAVSRFRLEA